jgi:hypothetical protein
MGNSRNAVAQQFTIVALFESRSMNPPYFSGKHKLMTRISKATSLHSLNQVAGNAVSITPTVCAPCSESPQ